jgi:peptide/nickel transport system ATP-binding protein
VSPAAEALLQVEDLRVSFGTGRRRRDGAGVVRAVDGVSLDVRRGELVALVGESGSGKTTTGLAVLRLVDADSGRVTVEGQDVGALGARALRGFRRRAQMIYQDPYESLDPRFTVQRTVEEPLLIHRVRLSHAERRARVVEVLERAGLTPGERFLERYPHELSGGQRQRVAIAASLVLEPALLVADEPVSMLDVSIRTSVLSVFRELRDAGLGILMITHDLSTARRFADRVVVMYLGRVVEEGPVETVLEQPAHPYTQALLSVLPSLREPERGRRPVLRGETSDATALPGGCRFHPRCPHAADVCRAQEPPERPVGEPQARHRAACHFADELIERER